MRTLTEHKTQTVSTFASSSGRLVSEEDRNGREISYAYSSDGKRLESVTDSQGRVTTVRPEGGMRWISGMRALCSSGSAPPPAPTKRNRQRRPAAIQLVGGG